MRRGRKDRYCILWPNCTCAHQWRRWQAIYEFEDEWQPDQLRLDCAEIDIRNMLDCIRRRCPDPEFRKHATLQLLHPVFRRQTTNGRWKWQYIEGKT
jgi:hypothetical protein